MRLPYLSKSRFQMFLDCEQKYWDIYVSKVKNAPGRAVFAELGTNVHQAIQASKELPDEEFEHIWETVHSRNPMDQEFYNVGLEMFKWYLTIEERLPGKVKEYEFHINSKETGAKALVPQEGYIDEYREIDVNTVHLVDYKTGYVIPTKEELDTSMEALFYCLAMYVLYGYSRFRFTWIYLRHEAEISRDFTLDQILEFQVWLSGWFKYMKGLKKPHPNFGEGCRYCHKCDLHQDIMAGNTKLKVPDVNTLSVPELLVKFDTLKGIEKVVKTMKGDYKFAIESIIGEEGEIITEEGHTAKLTQSWNNVVNTQEFFDEYKDEPWFTEVIKISVTEAKKLTKEFPEIGDMMIKVAGSKRLRVNVKRQDK